MSDMWAVIVSLTQGQTAIVDEEDADRVLALRWFAVGEGSRWYARRNEWDTATEQFRVLPMHRFILGAQKGQMIDHVNRDGLDNRRCNLRFCTATGNNRNRTLQRNNTSGFRGVSWDRSRRKWHAYIYVERKRLTIGLFDEVSDAAAAYDCAAVQLHGEFARTNAMILAVKREQFEQRAQ